MAIWRSACGAASSIDEGERRQAGQRLGQLDGIGDRGGGQQEARLGAVDGRRPPQPPQHVGDVRTEHAAVDVGLVDDDEGEVGEQVAPGRVVGQDPDVEHVGVGDDEVAALADRRALLARRVAVVDGRADRLVQPEAAQRARLVLGERLGRVEVEGPRARSEVRTSSVGSWKHSDLPEAVPVVTIVGPSKRLGQRLAPGGRTAARCPPA